MLRFGEPGWRATHSVGGIPFYVHGMTPTYPTADSQGSLGIGSRTEVADDDGFGELCTHSDLPPECTTDAECHPFYQCHLVGKVCVRKNIDTCGRATNNLCWCYVHSDCEADEMCSGNGKCTLPVIEVRNEMTEDEAEFRVYSESCNAPDTLSIDMYGGSPWGRIKDILHSHGLCSQRNWWEYNRTLSMSMSGSGGTCNLSPGTSSGTSPWCDLDTGVYAQRWRFSKGDLARDQAPSLSSQNVLKQDPHTCDRDYAHLAGFRSCVGSNVASWWQHLGNDGQPIPGRNSLNMSSLFRTYRRQNNSIRTRVGVMKHVDNPQFGFLGTRKGSPLTYRSWADYSFKLCSTIQTCYPQPFHLYGYEIKDRRFRVHGTNVPILGEVRPILDTFRCGAYGYAKDGKCVLDLGVNPLYKVLCYNEGARRRIISSCPNTLRIPLESNFITEYCNPFGSSTSPRLCNGKDAYQFIGGSNFVADGYVPTWTPENEGSRKGISCLINRFTDAFKYVNDADAGGPASRPLGSVYTDAMQCVQRVHQEIQGDTSGSILYNFPIDANDLVGGPRKTTTSGMSIYRFSTYGMYEFPFSWWVKCAVMQGRSPTDETVNCPEWTGSFDIGGEGTSSDWNTWAYLSRVNGGLWHSDPAARIVELDTQWEEIVNRLAAPSIFANYFEMDPAQVSNTSYIVLCKR